MLEVSIIIPVLNQWNYTRQCLSALFAHTVAIEYEVIVVDNGSTDGTNAGLLEFTAQHHNLHVLTSTCNEGYALANNRAAEVARGRYLVLLNNDTLPEPGWLAPLLEAVVQPGVGIVGPRLLYPLSRKVNHAGYCFDLESRTYTNRWCFAQENTQEVCKELDVLALLGACVCLQRALFLEVGGFENYGLEDIDLCLKIRERGYRVRYIPSSTVLHHGSVTLVNTDPSLLLAADTERFSSRWPPEVIAHMQAELPLEALASPHEHQIRVAYALEESVRLVTGVLTAVEKDQKYDAEFMLRCAIELWRANDAAYEELVVLLVQQRRIDEAAAVLATYQKVVPGSERAEMLARQFSSIAGST